MGREAKKRKDDLERRATGFSFSLQLLLPHAGRLTQECTSFSPGPFIRACAAAVKSLGMYASPCGSCAATGKSDLSESGPPYRNCTIDNSSLLLSLSSTVLVLAVVPVWCGLYLFGSFSSLMMIGIGGPRFSPASAECVCVCAFARSTRKKVNRAGVQSAQ